MLVPGELEVLAYRLVQQQVLVREQWVSIALRAGVVEGDQTDSRHADAARHASRLSVHRVEDFGADLRLDSVERALALEGLAERCAAQIAG